MLKIGRTHYRMPLPTFGQEISVKRMLKAEAMLKESGAFKELALGGTAVGTLNTHPEFAERAVAKIKQLTKRAVVAPNKFHALTSKMSCFAHGALKALAADLMKIANDVRWLASGPRCGLGELSLPTRTGQFHYTR